MVARIDGNVGKVVLPVTLPVLFRVIVLVGYLAVRSKNAPDAEKTVVNAARPANAHIEFKVLGVKNPPGTRDILLHFKRQK
jgi:hypothetical protein